MTSQKQTATAPHGHNDATQTLLDAFPDEAALIRADGTIIAINDAAAHRNGKRPEEVTGDTLFDLYPHDLAKERKARIDEVVRSGAPVRFQEERDEIRAEHTLYPVFDSEGQVHQVAIVSCDITATYRAQTERDRLQNHVNAQKKMMDALIAALPDYVWIYDKNMRFVYASREGAKMLGLTAGRMVGRTWRELGLPPDVVEPFEADVHYVFGTEQTVRKEMAFPTIKRERIYEYTLTPIHNGRDKVEQVLSVARDITERKQMEATVRQERDTAQRYLDVAGVIIVALDADGRVTLLNQLGCEVLECSTDEVLGVYWFNTFVPSSDREEAKATFRRLLAAEEELAQYYENPIITKSGKERLIAWHNAVVRDDEGRIVGTLSSGTDVTEQREMETKISESEHKYRELVEGANSIILELDIDGRITFINTFGKQFFGYTDEELIGRHVVGTIVPETETSGRDLATMIDGILADPDRYQDNVNENITKDGRRVWVSWTNRAIRTARGEVVGNRAIGNDITDLKRAEEKAESVAKFPEENPNPVLRLNSEGRILYANEASQKLLSNWDDTKERDDAAPQLLRDVTAEALSSQARTTIEVSVRSHVYKFFVAPIIDAGYVNFYGRDTTKRKWAENEAKRQARRADALNAIIAAGNRATDLQQFLKALLDVTIDVMNMQGGTVTLVDDATGMATLRCTRGIAQQFSQDVQQLDPSVPPLSILYTDKQPIFTDNVASVWPDLASATGYQSTGVVPLIADDAAIGALGVVFTTQRTFSDEEQEVLLAIGKEAGTTIAKLQAEEALRKIEWLLTKGITSSDRRRERHIQPYGDVTVLNTSRVIADSVGEDMLADIVEDYLELLDTSAAVYERDGSYALGLFSSGWCRLLDLASRERCVTDDNAEALRSGKWLCHESCWTDASRIAIDTGMPVDIECNGGIHIYAVPIYAGETIVGSMNFGYGDPPTDPATLQALANRYDINIDDLREAAEAYLSRPPYIIGLAKDRLMTSARLVGEMVHHKQMEAALQQAHDGLEQRVKERTLELQNEIEEREVIEEELRTTTDELLTNIKELRRAEQSLHEHTRRMEILNQIIRAGNEAIDLPSLIRLLVDRTVELLDFDAGALHLINEAEGVAELQYARGGSPDYSKERSRISIDEPHVVALLRDRQPLWTEHIELLPPELVDKEHMITSALIPLVAGGRVIGAYAVSSSRRYQFTESDKDLFVAIGREAGTVIARMQAEASLRKAHDELEQKVDERTYELQEEIEELAVTEEELRRTADELMETTEELTRSNQELEQFAYIASHDLQEPLRTVTSSVKLLEKGYKGALGAEADTFIGYAVDGTKRMQQLIKDLLAYSRVTSRRGFFAPVHCEDVLQHALDNLKIAIEESGVKITLPAAPMPTVMGDKMQLVQLFQNLIGNAIKFRGEQSSAVQIGVERDTGRNEWRFSVRDNGIGLDMQYADKIFTIFQRLHTSEQYPGTGVGLALCKKIVERHGGRIWVESEPEKGSTFYFTLPIPHTTEM